MYDSEREPDGVLLKACAAPAASPAARPVRPPTGPMPTSSSPPDSRGGKGIPETVAEHPRLFVTFTAPSFGSVHARKAQGRLVLPCHPYRQAARRPHGLRDGCCTGMTRTTLAWASRSARLLRQRGPGAMERWRRSRGAAPPSPSGVPWAGWSASRRASCASSCGISYAKVAEFQRRGVIHFHAVIRLDAATTCRCPGRLAPPSQPFTAALLEDALRQAVLAGHRALPAAG